MYETNDREFENWADRRNPMASKFRSVGEYQAELERMIERNRIGVTSEYNEETSFSPDGSPHIVQPNAFGFTSTKFNFNLPTDSKKSKVAFYRTMSYYPEIKNAIDIYSDEAIVMDSSKRVANLVIKKEVPDDIERLFYKEFDYVMNGVFRANEGELKTLFRKFIVDSELFIEYIKGDNDKDGIIGYQILPCYLTYPIYGANGQLQGFIQQTKAQNNMEEPDIVPLERNQVGYATWEKGSVYNVRGFLETAKRSYNQLLHLEDSVVIYRLVRAPERRLWNIEMGRVGNAKSEEYLAAIMNKYQRTLYYNPTDGKIDAQKTIQSMSDDYWFVKKEGQGSDVQVLQSGMNLGEINDINYILGKLYKSLDMPVTRWDPQLIGSNYQSGKQIEREELKFSNRVDEAKTKFLPIIKEAFVNHVLFKYKNYPNVRKWATKRDLFDVNLIQSNYFREYKDMERMADRTNLLMQLKDLSVDSNNPETKNNPLSRKWILTNPAIFGMTEEEWSKNEEMRKVELSQMSNKELTGGFADINKNLEDAGVGGVSMGGETGGGFGGVEQPENVPPAETGTAEEPTTETGEETGGTEPLTASQSFIKASKFLMESSPLKRK